MKRRVVASLSGVILMAAAAGAQAGPINPFDSCLNINGVIHGVAAGCFSGDGPAPGNVTDAIETDPNAADTGLGSVSITLDEIGDFFVGLFVDWEIDEFINGFDNEGFASGGTAAAGQSFEADEPGWVFGDIFDNFTAGLLDGLLPQISPEDISLALGWNFSLEEGETATVSFLLSETQPTSGLWLSHIDPHSDIEFFFSSTLEITGGEEPPPPTGVPEPGTLWLLGAALLGAAVRRGTNHRS